MTPQSGPSLLLPMLSRGKHRSPRRGACFMELASYLAGERWSDRPRCTHPLLAALARAVNDATTDAGRPRLALLVPSVIGLTSDDPHWDVEIALRAAAAGIRVASAERQNALAVGLLTCERVLDALDGREPGSLRPESRAALDVVPHAEPWARAFMAPTQVSAKQFATNAAPAIVGAAVDGIATACVPDPDALLADLLAGSIEECRTWAGRYPEPTDALVPDVWLDVCRPAPPRSA